MKDLFHVANLDANREILMVETILRIIQTNQSNTKTRERTILNASSMKARGNIARYISNRALHIVQSNRGLTTR